MNLHMMYFCFVYYQYISYSFEFYIYVKWMDVKQYKLQKLVNKHCFNKRLHPAIADLSCRSDAPPFLPLMK